MPNLQDPVNFSTEVQVNNHSIWYANLMEICQGGPLVGDFFVNGVRILPIYKFGGPLLVHLSKVYVPVFVRRFCISGFRIAEIDIETLQTTFIGPLKSLIYLSSIENSEIQFWGSMDRKELCTLEVPAPAGAEATPR